MDSLENADECCGGQRYPAVHAWWSTCDRPCHGTVGGESSRGENVEYRNREHVSEPRPALRDGPEYPTIIDHRALKRCLGKRPIPRSSYCRHSQTIRRRDLSELVRRLNARQLARYLHKVYVGRIRREGRFGRCAFLLLFRRTSPGFEQRSGWPKL